MTASGERSGLLYIAPLLVVMIACFNAPILLMLGWSVRGAPFTLRYYQELLDTPVYLAVIWTTVRLAIVTTILCSLVGYPLAYFMRGLSPTGRLIAVCCVVLPFWVSILVRTYAWIVILGNAGIFNRSLMTLGLIASPLSFIYNEAGVIVGTVNVLLPFFVLPLFASMLRFDERLRRAAETLGASRRMIFWRVFFPQTVPVFAASAILVFILTLGFYITPAVLGGGRITMVANLLDLLINQLPNWELAAAISTVLLAAVLGANALSGWLRHRAAQ